MVVLILRNDLWTHDSVPQPGAVSRFSVDGPGFIPVGKPQRSLLDH